MDNVIKFDPREKILEKAKKYLDDEEAFLEEREQAVPLLLKALEFGDETLKSEIIFLLGSFAKEEVAWPPVPDPCGSIAGRGAPAGCFHPVERHRPFS